MAKSKREAKRKAKRRTPAGGVRYPQLETKIDGLAEGLVVKTIAEAARLLHVSTRRLAEWCTDPTFPGEPGQRGKGEGRFPIAQIRAWRLAMYGPRGLAGETDEELQTARRLKALIDTDDAQVDLERKLGTIHDTIAAEQLIRRQINTAKALLEEIADKVNSRLPGQVPPKLRKVIRKAIDESIADTLNAVAELAAGDTDENEDAPDDEPDDG